MQEYVEKYDPTRSVENLMELRRQSGGFELLQIDEAEPARIVFRVKERTGPGVARGKIVVRGADVPAVLTLTVRLIPPGDDPPKDVPLDAATRRSVLDNAVAKLTEHYVFPDLAKKMQDHVSARHSAGEYDTITDGDAFAAMLTEHFREISKDKHLRVGYSARRIPEGRPERSPDAAANHRKEMERINCGFEKVERLAENIGYLKFNFFGDAEICGPTAIAAMNFLGGVDAIIFDLRENGGGQPAMIALISTYLFSDRTHLNDFYNRKEDRTTQYWTLPYVPGRRLADKPVYVLTSKRTFSGAEEFSYNLKNLKRGTIVGETTGGGAHPVSGHRIHDHFMIGVPFARAINPISKTNWEGTGVEPDVHAPGEEALNVALKLATKKLREGAPAR
jgi:hypothetical protein